MEFLCDAGVEVLRIMSRYFIIPEQWVLSFNMHQKSHRGLVKTQFAVSIPQVSLSNRPRLGPKICISCEVPGDTEAADSGITL